jgi:hypothetical protein
MRGKLGRYWQSLVGWAMMICLGSCDCEVDATVLAATKWGKERASGRMQQVRDECQRAS